MTGSHAHSAEMGSGYFMVRRKTGRDAEFSDLANTILNDSSDEFVAFPQMDFAGRFCAFGVIDLSEGTPPD
ncbi:MAG: hypothetical protein DCF30_21905 [Hyphomicrobiales bacterium]|nr:MAG: hypothetical protein DCF30_21905 [Hyphomicrobiales bacterium]